MPGKTDKWRILLIDDERDIRDVIGCALEDSGYKVMTAENGKTGLIKCKTFVPHFVVTDIRMPEMSGLELLEKIKHDHPSMEVIVITAFAEMDQAVRALQLDASDFITKPVSHEALILAIERAKKRYITNAELKEYTALLERENADTTRELIKILAFQKNLIQSSVNGILGCDMHGGILIFNSSMEDLTGYSREKAKKEMGIDHLFWKDQYQRFSDALSSDNYGGPGRLLLFETILADSGMNKIPVQVSATILLDQGGMPNGMVCFFRDLSEIRKLEQEMTDQARILHQDKIISLGRLSASIVHEINNPISGILNYARLMTRILDKGPLKGENQNKFRSYLELVETESRRCSEIVSHLLTFSRKSPSSPCLVNPGVLLHQSIALCRHKMEMGNIKLVLEIPPDLPLIKADFNQLQQCLINLIFNAMDAMPDGGSIAITAVHDRAENNLSMEVKDTGPGVDPADMPHIFEPFYTTKEEGYGVGLGLSLVYGIVESSGGFIVVENSSRGGAVFRIALPVHTDP